MVAKIAQAGVVDGNGLIWPGAVLREAARRFEGRSVYPRHEARLGGGRIGSEPWGFLRAVQFVGGDDDGYLAALVVPHDGRIERLLRETTVAGRPWGLSAHIDRAVTLAPKILPAGAPPNTRVLIRIDEVASVDLVEHPAIPGAGILTEASGVPILPNDGRVAPMLLLAGREAAPPKSRDPLAVLDERLDGLAARHERRVALREAVDTWGTNTADAFVAAFTARYGRGPWRIRSMGAA
jgi:hypothetical protein